MKTDAELQQDVMNELRWEPTIRAAEIGVGVTDGVVTLSGHVDSFYKKSAAERAAGASSVFKRLLKKSRSGYPVLLSGQMKRLPRSHQMLSDGMSKCPVTASQCRYRMDWLL